ncbi:MAG: signal recognition particle-docking protein FtsY [Syntrophomonas sp.]
MAFLDRFKGKKKERNEEPVSGNIINDENIGEEPEARDRIPVESSPAGGLPEDQPGETNHSAMGFFEKLRFKSKEKSEELPEENLADKTEGLGKESRELVSPEADTSQEGKGKLGFFEKLKKGLTKTRQNINEKIETLVKSSKKLDEDFWEGLEEILIQADVGVNTSVELVENIRAAAKKQKINDSAEVTELIQEEIRKLLDHGDAPLNISSEKPTVILVVGVNGTGKTTSIAKLAHRFKQEQQKVLLAAADTFRAAAIDQLQIWADRVGVELIKHQEGSDPGAVVFDALNAARARKADILIIDTAGRLQNKTNLMKEIGKVRNIIEREIPAAPHEVLLVLDATTGQNAISQARIFEEVTGVTGLVLTKLDGTAKGGIVLAIVKELNIPVKLVGIGESLEDLRDFSSRVFAEALFAKEEN